MWPLLLGELGLEHTPSSASVSPARRVGRLGWDLGSGAGNTDHVSAAPADGDHPPDPPAPGSLPGQSTCDQGCEAQAGRMGKNQDTPKVLPRSPPYLLALGCH